MMHKPTLKRERAVRYDKDGQMEMINNLEKVYSEIEVWSKIHHPNIAKIYELIDATDHDYLYLIAELCDLGQLAKWNFKEELYEREEKIFNFILENFLGN